MRGIKYYENCPAITSLEDMNELLLQLAPNAKKLTEQQLAAVINHSVFFTAVDSKARKTVGMATLTRIWKPTGFFGTLEDFVVHKDYRAHGIGTQLIKRVLKMAKQLKMSYIELTSNPARTEANALSLELGAHNRDSNLYRFNLK
jgi:GNAT superfamily N-acetyltransferase